MPSKEAPNQIRLGEAIINLGNGLNLTKDRDALQPKNAYNVELNMSALDGFYWKLTGNTGTNPSTNFLGTIDNQDLVIKTNSTERIRVKNSGNVGIGTNAPTKRLDVDGGTLADSGLRLRQIQYGVTTSTTNTTAIGIDANGNVAVTNSIGSADTRAVNNPPSAYSTGYTYEFKQTASLGLPAGFLFGYCGLETFRRYGFGTDMSGGYVYQKAIGEDANGNSIVFVRKSNGASAWASWEAENGSTIRSVTATATILLGDDTVTIKNGATAITLTLPNPALCKGKIFTFTRESSLSTGTITISGTSIQSNNGTYGATAILDTFASTGGAYGVRKSWQSTGTQYVLIN